MSSPLTGCGRSTSMKRGEEDFPLGSYNAYRRIPSSQDQNKIVEVGRAYLPRAEADIWPFTLSIAFASGPGQGIASAAVEPPPKKSYLDRTTLPKAPPPAEAYGSARSTALPAQERAPRPTDGIASAMLKPSPMRPPLDRKTMPKAPAPAGAYHGARSIALDPAPRAFEATQRIASALLAPPPMRPTQSRIKQREPLPPGKAYGSAAGASGLKGSFQLPPTEALPKAPVGKPRAVGFLVPYTGRDLLPGERVYPLQTPERFHALALPIGMAP
jgi:hypothetical protein